MGIFPGPKTLLFFFLLLTVVACTALPDYERAVRDVKSVDVLLVSDHTLPQHLNLASGGANGEERRFIDPTIASLKDKLEALDLSVQVLNVEDMVEEKDIRDEEIFNLAYERYDAVLRAAVAASRTILAIHYDADFVPAAEMGTDNDYVGGAQVILDRRSASAASIELANTLIFGGKVLEQLNAVGLRIRPDYDDAIRYQDNLTLDIAGASDGGAVLLEIGAQEQAQVLFGDEPGDVVTAIDRPLAVLADTIYQFRLDRGH